MSLVKILDFCSALKVKEGTVRSKLSRGQLVCNENRLIDTENPINYRYIIEINGGDQSVFEEHCIANVIKKVSPAKKNNTKVVVSKKIVSKTPKKTTENHKKDTIKKHSKIKGSVKVAPTVETKKIPIKKEPKLSKEEIFQHDLARQQNQTLLEIDIAKKRADLMLVERNAEVKKMQLEKIMGNTLPLDQVMSIMAINFKSIYKSFHSQLKNMTSTMVQNLGGTKEDYNSIMVELEQHLNNIRDLAKEKAQIDIDNLIEEYSEVRSRGERKS